MRDANLRRTDFLSAYEILVALERAREPLTTQQMAVRSGVDRKAIQSFTGNEFRAYFNRMGTKQKPVYVRNYNTAKALRALRGRMASARTQLATGERPSGTEPLLAASQHLNGGSLLQIEAFAAVVGANGRIGANTLARNGILHKREALRFLADLDDRGWIDRDASKNDPQQKIEGMGWAAADGLIFELDALLSGRTVLLRTILADHEGHVSLSQLHDDTGGSRDELALLLSLIARQGIGVRDGVLHVQFVPGLGARFVELKDVPGTIACDARARTVTFEGHTSRQLSVEEYLMAMRRFGTYDRRSASNALYGARGFDAHAKVIELGVHKTLNLMLSGEGPALPFQVFMPTTIAEFGDVLIRGHLALGLSVDAMKRIHGIVSQLESHAKPGARIFNNNGELTPMNALIDRTFYKLARGPVKAAIVQALGRIGTCTGDVERGKEAEFKGLTTRLDRIHTSVGVDATLVHPNWVDEIDTGRFPTGPLRKAQTIAGVQQVVCHYLTQATGDELRAGKPTVVQAHRRATNVSALIRHMQPGWLWGDTPAPFSARSEGPPTIGDFIGLAYTKPVLLKALALDRECRADTPIDALNLRSMASQLPSIAHDAVSGRLTEARIALVEVSISLLGDDIASATETPAVNDFLFDRTRLALIANVEEPQKNFAERVMRSPIKVGLESMPEVTPTTALDASMLRIAFALGLVALIKEKRFYGNIVQLDLDIVHQMSDPELSTALDVVPGRPAKLAQLLVLAPDMTITEKYKPRWTRALIEFCQASEEPNWGDVDATESVLRQRRSHFSPGSTNHVYYSWVRRTLAEANHRTEGAVSRWTDLNGDPSSSPSHGSRARPLAMTTSPLVSVDAGPDPKTLAMESILAL